MKELTFWRYWILNKFIVISTKIQQEHSICGIISCKIWKRRRQKKIQHNLFFTQVCFQFFLQICGYKSGFAVENPQNSVWLDWLSAQPKNSNAPLWRVCQPWIHESECLSTIPFARNTESNTWSTYNTRTSGRGHRPWRCRQRGN